MHNLLLISLFLFSFVCSPGNTKNITGEPEKIKPPDGLNDKQAVLPAVERMEWAFGRNYKTFTPTLDDIKAAESILLLCFNKEVSGTVNPFKGRKLEDYYRQFVCGVKENGDKIIYINCFCYVIDEYFKNWKTNLIMVDDGGNCFFNVKANLTKNEYYELMVNGLP